MTKVLEFIWLFTVLSIVTTLALALFLVLLTLVSGAVLVIIGIFVLFSPLLALGLVFQGIAAAMRNKGNEENA